jgi:NADH-quinone oxidoreductase subunit B
MAERVKKLYDQMPSPKYVIAMGACATVSGGPYIQVRLPPCVKGVDRVDPRRRVHARVAHRARRRCWKG